MSKAECEGCGAPLVRHRHDCEYCRRVHTQVETPGTDLQRYGLGYTDPRALYNQQMMNNLQGQAMADYYNQQNAMNSAGNWNLSPLAQLGGVGNGWFGRGW